MADPWTVCSVRVRSVSGRDNLIPRSLPGFYHSHGEKLGCEIKSAQRPCKATHQFIWGVNINMLLYGIPYGQVSRLKRLQTRKVDNFWLNEKYEILALKLVPFK